MFHKTKHTMLLYLAFAVLASAQSKNMVGEGVTKYYSLDELNALEISDPNDKPGGVPGKYLQWNALRGLKQEDFAAMSYDDDRLKTAWLIVALGKFTNSFNPRNIGTPEAEIFLKTSPEAHFGYAYLDFLQRGESAPPHLIALAQEPEMKGSREELLLILRLTDLFGEKYHLKALDFCRKYIRERPRSPYMINAVNHLEKYGGAEDVELMEWIGSVRPLYTQWMKESVAHLKKRLAEEAANANKPKYIGTPKQGHNSYGSTKLTSIAKKQSLPTLTLPNEALVSTTSWVLIVILIVAAIGLLWLLLKKRN